jgi:hypothetical protein
LSRAATRALKRGGVYALLAASLGLGLLEGRQAPLRVGFIDAPAPSRAAQQEIDAAFDWLRSRAGLQGRRLGLAEIVGDRSLDLLWWHEPEPGAALARAEREALRGRVEQGTGLFLSLAAVARLLELGLEETPPNARLEGARTWEANAMFGFEPYSTHPLFEPFHGGLYVWRPADNEPYWRADYAGDLWPRGRVIAVEKAHIALEPRRRVIWEHRLGEGRVLAISSFLYFRNPGQRFRAHLERFTEKALAWLAAGSDDNASYWKPRSLGVFLSDRSLGAPASESNRADAALGAPLLEVGGEAARSVDPWNLSGLRLLACGQRSGKVSEVWAFPVRVLKDLEWGVRFSGEEETRWLGAPERFRVTPHAVEWEFRPRPQARIRLRAWVDRELPALLGRFEVDSPSALSVRARLRPELTSQWPRLEGDLGAWELYRDPESGWAGWRSEDKNRAAVAAWSRQARAVVGEAEAYREKLPPAFTSGSRGELREPVVASEVDWTPGEPGPVFALVGGALSLEEASRRAAELLQAVESSFAAARRHSENLLEEATAVEGPDPSWNEGYRWAVAMLDRFEVETPGVGRGLMAGFEASRPGWFRARPGYGWYFGRDALWSVLALDALGRFDAVERALDLLQRYQEFTGKIFHELTPTGSIHYDAADSTPLYLIALAHHLRAAGRIDFLKRHEIAARRALAFLRSTDTDGDGLIENTEVGHGWIEGGKLYGGHTTFYLAGLWAEALRSAEQIFTALGESGEASRARAEFERVRAILERDF